MAVRKTPQRRRRGLHRQLRRTRTQRWQELVWPSMGARAWMRWLWLTLARQADNPHKVALGFAVGVWVSFTPVLGTHLLIAAVVCWFLRASFIASLAGSWVGNPWTYGLMWWGGYELGQKILRTPHVDVEDMLHGHMTLDALWNNAETLMKDVLWPALLGGWLLGIAVGAVFYALVYWQVARWRARRKQRMQQKPPRPVVLKVAL